MSDYPWYFDFLIDLITLGIVLAWMGWTYTTMQQHGPSPLLLITSVSVVLVLVLVVYRQRLTYLKLGDKVVAGFENRRDMEQEHDHEHEHEREREQYR